MLFTMPGVTGEIQLGALRGIEAMDGFALLFAVWMMDCVS